MVNVDTVLDYDLKGIDKDLMDTYSVIGMLLTFADVDQSKQAEEYIASFPKGTKFRITIENI